LQLIDQDANVLLDASMHAKDVQGIDTKIMPGYLAYSPAKTVEGDIIYVGQGTYPDFDKLEAEGIKLEGRICLARYGGGHRGEKVRNCAERGGIATIIFSNPDDAAPLGNDEVFPKNEFVGGSALQRGALYTYGDPETPGYPSIKEALRIEDTPDMPTIPALTMNYDDARTLFGYMGGEAVPAKQDPAKWNMVYNRGPLKSDPAGMKVRLIVKSKWERLECFNVIGVIKGEIEPDRYSILGNHHDAWGFGAIDPSSGTAPMMEQAYVLGQLVKKGIWRPRRSIIFCSWSAEEIAIAGSGEWVEARAMFVPYASPMLRDTFYAATQMIPHGQGTLLDFWRIQENVAAPAFPGVRLTHGGSDNNAFNFFAGVPGVALTFRQDSKKYKTGTYSSYHTAYETLYLYEKFIDSNYTGMKRCAQCQLLLTLYLAEAELLPYNMSNLGAELSIAYGKLVPKFASIQGHNADIG
ncbi:unnamed protein product, partial [Ixodes hexagonus]